MPPVVFGLHCSHEQHPPSALLRHAKLAAQAGFSAAMCSDHFHPWSERQGQSGFTWSWLGAALEATPLSFGTVCAPGQRYHPAVIAQAVATLAEMYADRLWLAIGSGEALNESITGESWPPKPERNERLEECARIMRALWAGETVDFRGRVTARGARLYSRPANPPLLLGAALTPDTARLVGRWADGMITAAGSPEAMRATVEAFRETAGPDKPMFLQVALAFAPSREEAAAAAHDQWRHCVLPPAQLADLDSPLAFDRACDGADLDEVIARVRVSSEFGQHVEWLQADADLGFSRIYLHNVARAHQERFIEACAAQLLPPRGSTRR